MARLRTDDSVRRLRALWLGPPGCRWPFDATYVEWMLGTALTLTVGVLLWIITTVALGFPYNYLITLSGAPSIGGLLAWLVRPHVEPNTPVAYWVAGIRTELRGAPQVAKQKVSLPMPRIVEEERDLA